VNQARQQLEERESVEERKVNEKEESLAERE
jgi:hypothetical protein